MVVVVVVVAELAIATALVPALVYVDVPTVVFVPEDQATLTVRYCYCVTEACAAPYPRACSDSP